MSGCQKPGCTLIVGQHFHGEYMPTSLDYTARGAEYANRVWLEWLVDIGYGVDFTHNPPPPCEPADLAEVYAETDGEPVEDWTAILLDGNTAGGWYGNREDHP